jgi:hypothetical protein
MLISRRWSLRFIQTLTLLTLVTISITSQASDKADRLDSVIDATPVVRFIGLRQYSSTSTQIPLPVEVTVDANNDLGISRVELYVDQAFLRRITSCQV